jgi:glycosyltransferase involved in cell wall biosynthesis
MFNSGPKLSVVIPCYNQGRFLPDALRSCQDISLPSLEILVVDDGSQDDTADVAKTFRSVRYIIQDNTGLPGARNKGISEATGEYICFLDADDWFIPKNLAVNLRILASRPDLACISGCHREVWAPGDIRDHCRITVKDIYQELLFTNFIGNPSCVIYRKSVLEEVPFSTDPLLRGCEDYDHYLTIARKFNILHNPIAVSMYRRHEANMSNNHLMMLNSALHVLLKHKQQLRTPEEAKAWKAGWKNWIRYYGYFPLVTGHKKLLTRHHLELARKLGPSLPIILLKKLVLIIEKKYLCYAPSIRQAPSINRIFVLSAHHIPLLSATLLPPIALK